MPLEGRRLTGPVDLRGLLQVGLDSIRDLLSTGGRTLAQGALAWILARSPVTLPIPGFKTEAQIHDNLGTLDKGPLPRHVMQEIDVLLREPVTA